LLRVRVFLKLVRLRPAGPQGIPDCEAARRVLGSTFFFQEIFVSDDAMPIVTVWRYLRRFGVLASLAVVSLAAPLAAQQNGNPPSPGSPAGAAGGSAKSPAKKAALLPAQAKPGGETATLEADQQRQVGKIYYADGHVDVHYENTRLRADHVEYNEDTQVVIARGNVQLDYLTQHVEAEDARYELATGRGIFHHVRVTFAVQRRQTPTLLISPNPIYFEADEAERINDSTYKIHKAWMTVCDPKKPTWKFYAPEATVYMQNSVHLENGNFRLFSIPVLYLPYTTFPAEKQRASGFLIPDIGESSSKGFIFGDAYYWAPTDWADLTVGANYYSRRGWSQRADLRLRPWENARLDINYTGVVDRGLPQAPPAGGVINQGGHEAKLLFTALLPDGWRAVADLDNLSSLTYRIAFGETFVQAINSEVRNTAFLANNFRGFSLDFAALSYKNYVSASPDTFVSLRTAPEARFSSVDQAPWEKLPIYFSFDAFTSAGHRSDTVTGFQTPNFVARSEIAPTVTIPLHFGPWLDLTPSFTFRSTYYGGQLQNGLYVGNGFFRETEEFSLDIRPPTIERVWGDSATGRKWKHVIEPEIIYSYVNGVKDFARFVRFDEDETLTDTNEIQYGVTQRLYFREGEGGTQEVVSWNISEKYFFDPSFGGALVPGQRNVFQATDSLTPFAFLDQARHFSPIVSNVRFEPGRRFDTQFIMNLDPRHGQIDAIGELVKWKPYREYFITLAHFSVINLPTPAADNPPSFDFEPRSNQVRTLVGYGDLTRRGFNATFGVSYDLTRESFQNQVAAAGYNGSCCGMGFEYRRFSFGNIRSENQYLVVFRIANLGSLGTLRRAEKIF
jgi:LPS-assembly protein